MNQSYLDPRRLAMSLRQIEVFRAVMIAGSVSEAARMLAIAQPSVSRVVQLTEERIGFLLFERVRGRLLPTPEAKRVFDEVESAYAGVQRVDELVRALREGRSGRVNVVCSPSLGVHVVPRAIARFHQRYPELPVTFEPLTHNNLIPRVLLGQNHLGISMFDVVHPNLETEALTQVQLMAVAPQGRLPPGQYASIADLLVHPWIDYQPDTPLHRVVGNAFRQEVRPPPIVEVRSALSACQLVMQGVGVALVDPFCIDAAMRERIDVRPLAPAQLLDARALYSHAEPLSHAARSFIATVREVLKEDHPT